MSQAEVRKARYRMGKLERKNTLIAYSFLAPNFIGFAVFTLIPVICAVALSLFEWGGGDISRNKDLICRKKRIRLDRDGGSLTLYISAEFPQHDLRMISGEDGLCYAYR